MGTQNNLEQEIEDLIKSLHLPPVVLEIFNETIVDSELEELLMANYSKPYSILDLNDDEREVYQLDRYKPILEFNGSQILAYDISKAGFILYYLEVGIEDPLCLTWDGVWLDELSVWWEDEWSDDEVRKVGKALGLKHVEIIIESLKKNDEEGTLSTFEEKEAWINKMMDDFNMRIL